MRQGAPQPSHCVQTPGLFIAWNFKFQRPRNSPLCILQLPPKRAPLGLLVCVMQSGFSSSPQRWPPKEESWGNRSLLAKKLFLKVTSTGGICSLGRNFLSENQVQCVCFVLLGNLVSRRGSDSYVTPHISFYIQAARKRGPN